MAKTIDVKHNVSDLIAKSTHSKVSVVDIYINHTKADRKLRSIVNKSLKTHEISLMHWLLLSIIAKPKEGLPMKQIATRLGVSLPGATSLVNQLKERRLIIQKTDRRDRRQRLVVPSAKGRALMRLVKAKLEADVKVMLKPIPSNYLVFYERVVETIGSVKN